MCVHTHTHAPQRSVSHQNRVNHIHLPLKNAAATSSPQDLTPKWLPLSISKK